MLRYAGALVFGMLMMFSIAFAQQDSTENREVLDATVSAAPDQDTGHADLKTMPVPLKQEIILKQSQDRAEISAIGEAELSVKSDRVVVVFEIETREDDLLQARNKNNAILKRAINECSKMGIKKTDIHTDYISLEPRYEPYYKNKAFLGYFVQNRFSVTLRNLSKFESLATDVIKTGVTAIRSLDLQITDRKKYENQAMLEAVKSARKRAKMMADVLGKRLGDPLKIHEIEPMVSGGDILGRKLIDHQQQIAQKTVRQAEFITSDWKKGTVPGRLMISAKVRVTFALE